MPVVRICNICFFRFHYQQEVNLDFIILYKFKNNKHMYINYN